MADDVNEFVTDADAMSHWAVLLFFVKDVLRLHRCDGHMALAVKGRNRRIIPTARRCAKRSHLLPFKGKVLCDAHLEAAFYDLERRRRSRNFRRVLSRWDQRVGPDGKLRHIG